MSIADAQTACAVRPEILKSILKLHQANIDSAKGFEEASEKISRSDLAADFRRWADQRTKQAHELAEIAESNGASIDRDSSWLADLHRAYLALREALSGNDIYAVLAEAERGEDHIKDAYEEVLKATTGTIVKRLLNDQYAEVKVTHDRIRELRDACKND